MTQDKEEPTEVTKLATTNLRRSPPRVDDTPPQRVNTATPQRVDTSMTSSGSPIDPRILRKTPTSTNNIKGGTHQ